MKHRLLLTLTPTAHAVARKSLATPIADIATFAAGNGSITPDQYPGIAGDGWLTPWQPSAPAAQAKVLSGKVASQPAPLDQIDPRFLQVTTADTAAISRSFAGTAGITSRVIQFDYRFDGTTNGNNNNDYITLFGDNKPAPRFTAAAVATTYTWAIKAYINATGAVWEFGGRIPGKPLTPHTPPQNQISYQQSNFLSAPISKLSPGHRQHALRCPMHDDHKGRCDHADPLPGTGREFRHERYLILI